ncbi:hypothetical protein BOTCAL_0586g00040 [Botryotinia calthae]|uniref:Transcription factor domain-containing protein n=1 Tax=Botryotinia calthae TaxID=38488 RepID=A0A4Y8CLU9_9HELO|nr:hypothetical protein BOTCAL_0586g00040 [Botryotinia calthae]
MIELDLQEALPAPELINELHHIFSSKLYPVIPIIQEYRYHKSLTRALLARPPICLRYLEASEMKGEGLMTIYHAQSWCLIAMPESKNARFPQSWLSVGRANLPVSELSFRFGIVEETKPFTEAFSPRGLGQISSFYTLLLATKLYGHNHEHLNINTPKECVGNFENGEFWKRHRRLDNALLKTFFYLPDSLRLPHGIDDMNTAFVHMSIHTSSINLHQGAIAAPTKHGINSDIIRHSQVRTRTAAQEIINIMHQIDNVDVALLNSWTGLCLYVAASVLIKDQQSEETFRQGLGYLNYLLPAMQRIGQRYKITEHFYGQTR